MVGGFDKPYNPGGDEHIYNGPEYLDAPPDVVAYDPELSQTGRHRTGFRRRCSRSGRGAQCACSAARFGYRHCQ
jgi:hypothetical protein